jgi:Flp pilus assembly protein TadG
MTKPARVRNERGATLVEVPLALIWVFLAVFGLTEAGRMVLAYTTLADAARAGTRYAIVHGSYRTGSCTSVALDGQAGPSADPPCVVAVVKGITTAAGFSTATVHVSYPNGTNKIADPVTVSVSYDYKAVLPMLPIPAVTLKSTSEGTICY